VRASLLLIFFSYTLSRYLLLRVVYCRAYAAWQVGVLKAGRGFRISNLSGAHLAYSDVGFLQLPQ
jgi:hypothetical protein